MEEHEPKLCELFLDPGMRTAILSLPVNVILNILSPPPRGLSDLFPPDKYYILDYNNALQTSPEYARIGLEEYLLYFILCISSGKFYIGETGQGITQRNVIQRLKTHVTNLENQSSHSSPLFAEEFRAHPRREDWNFSFIGHFKTQEEVFNAKYKYLGNPAFQHLLLNASRERGYARSFDAISKDMKAFWAPISSEDRITATAHFQEEKTKEKRDEGINRYWSGLSEEQLAQRMIFVNDPAVKKRKKEKMQAIGASGGGNCKPVRIHGVCYPSLHHAVPKFQKRKAAGTYSGPTGDKKIRELLNAEKKQ